MRVGNRYSISEEDDVIYYGFENGQLSYEIESMVNAINYQVIYEDGKEKVTYVKLDADKAKKIVEEHLVGGKVVNEYTIGEYKKI